MVSYENYAIKNNVFGTLSAPISSLATTIQLGDGQGARFSVNQLATLENIEDGKVKKREIVLITAINGDVLTVTRKVAPCPSSDEANTQGQTSYAFSADDTISAYITKEHFDKIDDSINDIYDNGVNKLRTEIVSGLQIKVNAGPVLVGSGYYDFAGGTLTLTDNATNYIEIDQDGLLVSSTTTWTDENTKISKVITSGGQITSIEDWRLGTVGGKLSGLNIHDLTEKTSLASDDEFVIADSANIYNNKKVKADKLQQGLVYGDGSDGDCHITSSCKDSNTGIVWLQAKEYNFNNLTIDSGICVMFCGKGVPVIKVKNCFCNLGTIDTYGPLVNDDYGVYVPGIGEIMNKGAYIKPFHTTQGGYGSTCVKIDTDPDNPFGVQSLEGKGGDIGQNGYCWSYQGGTGTSYAGGGGSGAQCKGCNASGCDGGDGGCGCCYSFYAGGGGAGLRNGGNGGNMVNSYTQGAPTTGANGGDGYYGNGGNGGTGEYGGDGGNSMFGNGGNGYNGIYGAYCSMQDRCMQCCFFVTKLRGNGGNSYYGNGGNSVGQLTSVCNWGKAGSGGMGRNGGNGGNICYHNYYGVAYGGDGGNAINGHYGLAITAKDFYNNCIIANGGNGGNGGCAICPGYCSAYNRGGNGGNGADGRNVCIIYKNSLTCGNINVSGGCGGCKGIGGNGRSEYCGLPGKNGCDGQVFVKQI